MEPFAESHSMGTFRILAGQSGMKPLKPLGAMKPMAPSAPMEPMKAHKPWWPKNLGSHPNSGGGQNRVRYAFFKDKRRLALDSGDGNIQIFDTGDHAISGVQQGQSGQTGHLVFTSQHGEVNVETLKQV